MKTDGNKGTRHCLVAVVRAAFLGFLSVLLLLGIGCATNSDILPPHAINEPVLDYPPEAILNRESGEVVVLLYLDAEGTADSWQIKRSSGIPILDETGIEFVKTLEFLPLVEDGRKKSCWVEQEVVFSLTKPTLHPDEWRRTTRNLMKQLEHANPAEKEWVQQRLYRQCTDYMSAVITHKDLALNRISTKLVNPSLRKSWAKYTNAFPMSFLMFADYVQRVEDSPYRERAMAQLKRSVEVDILLLENKLHSNKNPELLAMRQNLRTYLAGLQ